MVKCISKWKYFSNDNVEAMTYESLTENKNKLSKYNKVEKGFYTLCINHNNSDMAEGGLYSRMININTIYNNDGSNSDINLVRQFVIIDNNGNKHTFAIVWTLIDIIIMTIEIK